MSLASKPLCTPEKLYLEASTRCNLRCRKCVKQIEDSVISEADFPYPLFQKLLPSLRSVQSLVLNGIGEPLLNPDLEKMIREAKRAMTRDATIGFQSNGALLSVELAADLADAGLGIICFSLDSLEKNIVAQAADAPDYRITQTAISNSHKGADIAGVKLQVGLEVVVSKSNSHELPALIEWAAEKGVDFILVTHLFAYSEEMARDSLFGLNSSPALDLYKKYKGKAEREGFSLDETLDNILSSKKMIHDSNFLKLLQEMRLEAASLDIPLHFQNLREHDEDEAAESRGVFRRALELAGRLKVDLRLPELQPQHDRMCQFIQDNSAFINVKGDIMPCHFLWHSYPCMAGNDRIVVQERRFGNIAEMSLEEIWQQPAYQEFRRQALQDVYSRCWSCPQSPCSDVVNTNILGINDCHGSSVPCGHCRWSIGGLHCL